MTTEALQTTEQNQVSIPMDVSALAVQAALAGDLSKLQPEERLKFYAALCHSERLNPLTKPFDWLTFQGKLVLYANKSCAEQKRTIHGVTISILERTFEHGCHIVRVSGRDRDGRTDEAIGAVACAPNAPGEVVANVLMKAETKAKRRVTFSLCGLSNFIQRDTPEEITHSESKTTIGTLQVETASDRAKMLSEAVSPSIEVQEVKESAAASQTTAVHSQAADAAAFQNNPPETKSGPFGVGTIRTEVAVPSHPTTEPFANPDGTLTDTTVRNLEVVMSEKTPAHSKNFMGWLISKKGIKAGQDLKYLNHEAANRILNRSVETHEAVERWARKQNVKP